MAGARTFSFIRFYGERLINLRTKSPVVKAVGILPGQAGSVSLLDVSFPEDPGPSQVLVKVLQNGVCATDREINQGLYGAAPSGSPYLILGHESLGIIEEVGKDVEGFLPGDLVVPMVRRPCDHCRNCHAGEQDMCLKGDYVETGIKGLHGSMQEYYVDTPQYLVKIPPEQREVWMRNAFAHVLHLGEPLAAQVRPEAANPACPPVVAAQVRPEAANPA